MKNIIKISILALFFLLSAYPALAATKLTWGASSGTIVGYRIYYGLSSGKYTGMEEIGNVTQYPLAELPLQEKTTYYLAVTAFNNNGESKASNEIAYYCPDSTPPSPPQGLSKQVSGSNIVLSWTANTDSDLAGYNVYQGASSRVYGTPNSLGKVTTYTISGLTVGKTYYFTVSALDGASNESGYSNEVNATIADSTVPTVAITSPTTSGIYSTTSGTITISGTASDNSGVSTVTWANAANGTSGTATGTTSWSKSGISLVSGANTLTVTASDSAGNKASKTLTVTYTAADTTAPSVAITSPTATGAYSTTSGTINISGTASDNVGVTSVTWSNDANGTSGTATGTTSWSISGASLSQGDNTFTVIASDRSGNTAGKTLTVTYTQAYAASDTAAPALAITSPTATGIYATTSGTITISGTASDNVGVTSVTWSNDANDASGTASGTTSWSISGASLSQGDNTFTVTASDSAGNTSGKTLTVTYTQADTDKPAIALTSPTTGSTYSTTSGMITISGTARDNVGVSTITWANSANGTKGTASGTTSWSVSGISLNGGSNTIAVTAADNAGNMATTILTVTYTAPKAAPAGDITKPVVTITSPTKRATYTLRSKHISVKLVGKASDNKKVTKVTWENAANGTSGTATGTKKWTVKKVPLIKGANAITVTAYDAAGNASTDTLTVTRKY